MDCGKFRLQVKYFGGVYFSSHPMELIAYEKLVGKSQGAAGTLRKLGRQVRFMHDHLDT